MAKGPGMGVGEKVRVLMVVPYFPPPVRGGLERQAWLLGRELAADGHRVTVMARRFALGQGRRETCAGMRVVRLAMWPRLLDGLYHFLLPGAIFLRRRDFDIMHVHTLRLAGLMSLCVAWLMGKRTLLKVPSAFPGGIPGLGVGMMGGLRRWVVRRADAAVAMSPQIVGELVASGYPPTRILRAVNGVEVACPGPTGAEGRGGTAIEIVFLGRLMPCKGVMDLLAAWELLQGDCPGRDIRLSIHGAGPQASAIRTAMVARGLGETVRLCGHAEDVAGVLGAADLLVLPSHGEGNSNVVLEAMAAGLPVVSTALAGTQMQVGEAGREFLHAPGDAAGLAGMLAKLCRDGALRAAVGNRMRERARRHFALGPVKERYLAAYRLILAGNRDMIGTVADFPPN